MQESQSYLSSLFLILQRGCLLVSFHSVNFPKVMTKCDSFLYYQLVNKYNLQFVTYSNLNELQILLVGKGIGV